MCIRDSCYRTGQRANKEVKEEEDLAEDDYKRIVMNVQASVRFKPVNRLL